MMRDLPLGMGRGESRNLGNAFSLLYVHIVSKWPFAAASDTAASAVAAKITDEVSTGSERRIIHSTIRPSVLQLVRGFFPHGENEQGQPTVNGKSRNSEWKPGKGNRNKKKVNERESHSAFGCVAKRSIQ